MNEISPFATFISPFATSISPRATRISPFATFSSSFATRFSRFPNLSSSFAKSFSPVATRCRGFATRSSTLATRSARSAIDFSPFAIDSTSVPNGFAWAEMSSASREISIAWLEISIARAEDLSASLEGRSTSVAQRFARREAYVAKLVVGIGSGPVQSSTDDLAYPSLEIRVVSVRVLCSSAEELSRMCEVPFWDDEVSSTWLLSRGAPQEDDAARRDVFVRPLRGRAGIDAGLLTGITMSRESLTG